MGMLGVHTPYFISQTISCGLCHWHSDKCQCLPGTHLNLCALLSQMGKHQEARVLASEAASKFEMVKFQNDWSGENWIHQSDDRTLHFYTQAIRKSGNPEEFREGQSGLPAPCASPWPTFLLGAATC